MAINILGTTVIDDSRNIQNIGIITATTLNTNTFTATGQSIINRVAISTVGVNTTLKTGRTYVYFAGVFHCHDLKTIYSGLYGKKF